MPVPNGASIEYLSADNGQVGAELWRTDGSTAGTVLVKDINPGLGSSKPAFFTKYKGETYFQADDGVHGMELWKTNGSTAGTVLVKDINPGADGSFELFGKSPYFTEFNGLLYFKAYDSVHGFELWKSDGTAAGTVMVFDINTDPAVPYPPYKGSTPAMGDGYPMDFTVFNNALYFTAQNTLSGRQVWKTDGSAVGTKMVSNVSTMDRAYGLTPFNGELYFQAYDTQTYTYGLWKTDGSTAGTVLVKNVGPRSNLVAYNGALYFAGQENVYGIELWKTQGSDATTVLVKDIDPRPNANGFPGGFIIFQGELYFSAANDSGFELWKTNGTEARTVMVKDINAFGGSQPLAFTEAYGVLFFSADDGIHGRELWKTDGTAAGTVLVKDIIPGGNAGPGYYAGDSSPHDFKLINNELYFRVYGYDASGSTASENLWKTDGTSAGTVLVKDFRAP